MSPVIAHCVHSKMSVFPAAVGGRADEAGNARADRVSAIACGNHGKVIGLSGNIMTVELPADVAIVIGSTWGEGGSRKCHPR